MWYCKKLTILRNIYSYGACLHAMQIEWLVTFWNSFKRPYGIAQVFPIPLKTEGKQVGSF